MSADFSSNLESSVRPLRPYDLDFAGTFPWLLTNGFSAIERQKLLETLLSANTDGIRTLTNKRRSGAAKQTSAEVVARLSEPERLQLMLTVSDAALVKHLEILIASGSIEIGATEVRKPFMARHEHDGPLEIVAEAGTLGVRFVRQGRSLAPLRLRVFLRSLFENSIEELDWILRNENGLSAFAKLDHYLQRADLKEVINRLVMSSRSRLLTAIDLMKYGFLELPTDEYQEERLIRIILWKLGDSIPVPASVDAHLRELISIFDATIDRTIPSVDKLALEGFRSIGVNLFVELESILTQALEYACWLLIGDHYGVARNHRFRYSAIKAKLFTTEILSKASSAPEDFAWSGEGKNTLGTLIEGMRVLARECDQLIESAEQHLRPKEGFPFFASSEHVVKFPFLHTSQILDLEADSAARLINALRAAADEFERGNVMDLRNRFSHAREDMPSPAEMGMACDAVNKATDILVAQGLLPAVFVLRHSRTDAFGRALIDMRDGSNDIVTLHEPSEIYMCGLPGVSEPQLISRGAIISGTIHHLRLGVEEDTEFTRQWAEYQTGSGVGAFPRNIDSREGGQTREGQPDLRTGEPKDEATLRSERDELRQFKNGEPASSNNNDH